MTLFWLRVYTTYAVIGFFYELDRTNVEDNIKNVLATLEAMTTFTYERPAAERTKLHSPEAVHPLKPGSFLSAEVRWAFLTNASRTDYTVLPMERGASCAGRPRIVGGLHASRIRREVCGVL